MLGGVCKSSAFVAAACSRTGCAPGKVSFPSRGRPLIFHLNAHKYFCLSLTAPSASRHFKMQTLLFPVQPQAPVILTLPVSHLMPAVMFMVFIPPQRLFIFPCSQISIAILISPFQTCVEQPDVSPPVQERVLLFPTVARIRAWRETHSLAFSEPKNHSCPKAWSRTEYKEHSCNL